MHTMPRDDRTFTAGDILRLWANNLSREEQIQIKAFFGFLFKSDDLRLSTAIKLLGSAIGIIPVVGDAIEISLELLTIQDQLTDIAELGIIANNAIRESGLRRGDLVRLFTQL